MNDHLYCYAVVGRRQEGKQFSSKEYSYWIDYYKY